VDQQPGPGTAETPEDSNPPHSATASGNPGVAHSQSATPTSAPAAQRTQGGWSGLVYAVGQLTPQFPSIGVEKEFAQLTSGSHQGAQVEIGLLKETLNNPENRYLGRHLSWIFTTQHIETFAVLPRDDADMVRLAEVISPAESQVMHVVVGRSPRTTTDAPGAPLGLPLVVADQVLAFTLAEFAEAIPDAEESQDQESASTDTGDSREQFNTIVHDLFLRLTRRTGNHGIAEEHRALNYIAVRYPPVYHAVMQAHSEGKILSAVDTGHSHSGNRRVASVRLTFRHRRTEITERYQCLVDVTEVFPFLVTTLHPTYD
jgi:hypothetical protein